MAFVHFTFIFRKTCFDSQVVIVFQVIRNDERDPSDLSTVE